MEISVDVPLCQAYGLCVMEAPEYFEIDEDADKVRLLGPTVVSKEDAPAVEAAVRACPVFAIQLKASKADPERS